jgi:hypothetical protein
MSVCCECCVLSGRGLCDELVPRPEESYRLWCVSSVIVKPRKMRRPRPPQGAVEPLKKKSLSRRVVLGLVDVCYFPDSGWSESIL